MVVMMLAQPRIFLAMSQGRPDAGAGRAGCIPASSTPHVSTIVTGVVVAVAAGLTPIATLGTLVSIGTLMAFVIVSIGVIVLRRTRPELPRPFRMPLVPLLPALSALVAFVLMLGLPRATWERLIIWMVIGIVFYFAYGYRRSRLRARSIRQLDGGHSVILFWSCAPAAIFSLGNFSGRCNGQEFQPVPGGQSHRGGVACAARRDA